MTKLMVFDLDGTLADTITSIWYSVSGVLEEMQLPSITRDECQAMVGCGARTLMERTLTRIGADCENLIDDAMVRYGRIFKERCTYEVTPYDGITELLDTLKKHGVQIAILSNKPHEQTVKVAETVFGTDTFAVIWGQVDEETKKPNPVGFYKLLDTFGVKPEECIYVGDSEVDVATGHNAGVRTVLVEWGFRTKEHLRQVGAEEFVKTAKELEEMALQG